MSTDNDPYRPPELSEEPELSPEELEELLAEEESGRRASVLSIAVLIATTVALFFVLYWFLGEIGSRERYALPLFWGFAYGSLGFKLAGTIAGAPSRSLGVALSWSGAASIPLALLALMIGLMNARLWLGLLAWGLAITGLMLVGSAAHVSWRSPEEEEAAHTEDSGEKG